MAAPLPSSSGDTKNRPQPPALASSVNIIRGEECDLQLSIFCVFFTQYTLKRLQKSPEKKAAEISLLGDFLQRTEGLAGNWFEFAVIMQSRAKYTLCKKSRRSHFFLFFHDCSIQKFNISAWCKNSKAILSIFL